MANIIIFLIIAVIIIGAVSKVVIEKRRGAKCIGCPEGGSSCNCDHSK